MPDDNYDRAPRHVDKSNGRPAFKMKHADDISGVQEAGTKAGARRLYVFQPALPAYRLDFFDRLRERYGAAFEVRFSPETLGALSELSVQPAWAVKLAPMRRLLPGLDWQAGVLSTPVERGDIVVISGSPRNLSNMLMLVVAGLKGARTVWWGHYWSSTSRPYRFVLRLLLMKLSHGVLFYTDQEVAEYRRGLGKRDRRPVTALNNGINIEPIAVLRKPYAAAEREKALLFIGRLTAKAELSTLLSALAEPRLNDVRLEVVGDGPERTALMSQAQQLGIADRIAWHGGTTSEDAIARVANRCRIFVYPGGVGLSLIHAMAYGLPAVVHDERWAHMPEIAAFEAGRTGVAFHRGEPTALAKTVSDLLSDLTKMDHYSSEAITRTNKDFNTSGMETRFSSMIDQIGNIGDRN